MISNVALQSTDAASPAPSAGETADTGVFDALLALQSLNNADAESSVNAQLAGALEGADALAESQDDGADDSSDDTGSDDALWFLGASLPTLKVPIAPMPGGASVAAQVQDANAPVAAAVSSAAQSDTAKDLAQAVLVRRRRLGGGRLAVACA
jgi:hypothetical protein